VRLLLDTHFWVWLAFTDPRLGRRQLNAIERAARRGELYLSPISVWEVANLRRKGRLRLGKPTEHWVEEALRWPGLNLSPLTPEIALASGVLPEPFHDDLADRIIVATARTTSSRLMTADARILAYASAGHVAVYDG